MDIKLLSLITRAVHKQNSRKLTKNHEIGVHRTIHENRLTFAKSTCFDDDFVINMPRPKLFKIKIQLLPESS